MAESNPSLIKALRDAARRLSNGARYEWGHMARCNCGHLIQCLTGMNDREISRTVNHHLEEWTEHASSFCPETGRAVDEVFRELEKVGFHREDVIHLENLTDQRVLDRLGDNVHLRRNSPEDVVRYLEALADLLEEDASAPQARKPRPTRRKAPLESVLTEA